MTRKSLLELADERLAQLMEVRELALANGHLESWSKLYTVGYMIKLRVWR